MKLPIVAFGDAVLQKQCIEIDKDYPNLKELIQNMKETMDGAHGVGLAAPQIGKAIRLFIIDSSLMLEDDDETDEVGVEETFINATILEESGEEWCFEEGCLSIPDVRENVFRKDTILIEYFDENWTRQEKTFNGLTARVIQHEYDHIEGILFTDHLKPLKKRLLKKRLNKISEGKISPGYKMKYPRK
ncbi:MAG: peptide deformylase [Planctomycetota bacterium]|jgi:peptide deformylase